MEKGGSDAKLDIPRPGSSLIEEAAIRGGLDGVDAPGRELGPLIFNVEPLAPLVAGVVPEKGVYSLPRQNRDTITTSQRMTFTSRTTETEREDKRRGKESRGQLRYQQDT